MKTVMIVDDEQAIAHALAGALEDEGYRVVVEHRGHDALERLGEARPDVVILDLMMPLLTGQQTLRRLRANPAGRDIPVIIISASPAHQLGGDYDVFIEKPFDLDAVTAEVTRLCTREPNRSPAGTSSTPRGVELTAV